MVVSLLGGHLGLPSREAIGFLRCRRDANGGRAFFRIKQGEPDPAAIHWRFTAEDEHKVDEFYKAAISTGARNNISFRARLEYYADTMPLMYST